MCDDATVSEASRSASVNVGDPPALPGRHPEFASSWSQMGKLPRVSHSSITKGDPMTNYCGLHHSKWACQ